MGRVKNVAPAAIGSDLDRVQLETLLGDRFGVGARGVLAPASEAACGYIFMVGSTCEVRPHTNSDGALVTDSCSGTQLSNRSLPQAGYPTDPVPHQQWVVPTFVALAVIATFAACGIALTRRLLGGDRRTP